MLLTKRTVHASSLLQFDLRNFKEVRESFCSSLALLLCSDSSGSISLRNASMIQKTEESLIVHICTWFLATRKAWKGRRHARNQIAMKLKAARANISGIFLSKLKIPALVASRFTLILLRECECVYVECQCQAYQQ